MPDTLEEIKEKVQIDTQLTSDVDEEGQVIVHCSFHNADEEGFGPMGIRVWKSTFLIDEATGFRRPLIKAFNICYQPEWMFVLPGQTKKFTMVFEKLNKACKSFTFKEVIPQSGAFEVKGIKRNKSDVYHINLH
jgi:hypothetical protein